VSQITSTGNTTRISKPASVIFPWAGPAPASNNGAKEGSHDGGQSFGAVYANDLARQAMTANQSTQFPRGSIIVREKLADATATQPLLLTVMIKRASGFNPKANDWEFLAIDGAMTRVEERQKEGACLNCHKSQAKRDFVYSFFDAP
jgi:cytochrome P460